MISDDGGVGASGRHRGMLDDVQIREVDWAREIETVRHLFAAYAASLGIDLSFQRFDDELAMLPGSYAPPGGAAWLAWHGDRAVGCVALRPLSSGVAEMKRLYVDPLARGGQLGRRLVDTVCDAARRLGYRRLCLDTLGSMHAARAIYREHGFHETAPYCFNPLPDVIYMARALGDGVRDESVS